MNVLRDHPLIKFTVAFIVGIILQKFLLLPPLHLAISMTVLLGVVIWFRSPAGKSSNLFIQVLLYILIILTGAIIFEIRHTELRVNPLKEMNREEAAVYGTIDEVSLPHQGYFSFQLLSDSVHIRGKSLRGLLEMKCFVRCSTHAQMLGVYKKTLPGSRAKVQGLLSRGKEQRNPGEFDYAGFLEQQGIAGMLTLSTSAQVQAVPPSTGFFALQRHTARVRLAEWSDSLFNQETSALFKGLMLGSTPDISAEVKTSFINAGVAHVLVVSGLNVAYILLIFLLLLGRFPLWLRYTGAGVGVMIFWFLTGSSPPALRASIMGFFVIASVLLNRRSHPLNIFFLSAMIILIFSPSDLFTASFQLSFVGVFSLLIIYPPLKTIIEESGLTHPWLKKILLLFAMTLAAQIGILPITNYYFGKLSYTSLLSNLVVVPAVSFFLGAGILSLTVSSLFDSVGKLLGQGCNVLTSFIYTIVRASGTEEYSYISVQAFSFIATLLYYALLSTLVYYLSRFKQLSAKLALTALVIAAAALIVIQTNHALLEDGTLSVLFIDVGQGDATLIKLPDGETILVDAGNAYSKFDTGIRTIAPLLSRLGISKIDYGIISHFDADHSHGFAGLMKEGRIKRLIAPPPMEKNDSLFYDYGKAKDIPVNEWRDTVWHIGNSRIFPLSNEDGFSFAPYARNDRSICFILQYGKSRILFTGDAEKPREKILLSHYGKFLQSAGLKAAHHGSRTAASEEFLRAVNPLFTVISAGRGNRYEHPHNETLARIRMSGAALYRTDISGAVLFRSDGHELQLIPWR